jgi:2-aminoadipate transaminase
MHTSTERRTLVTTTYTTGTTTLPWSTRRDALIGSVIDSSTSLLARQSHDIVRFAMGSPAAEAIPVDLLSEINGRISAMHGADVFDYAATEGHPLLRTALLEFLDTTDEATIDARLMITSGGMQGLDLAGKLFVDPGDLVIVEAPTYTNGTATMLSYGADIEEVPTDQDGMVVELLPEIVKRTGRTPKAIYVIPNFQNPSGTTLSLARRTQLIELARQWNCIIIDDDPYGLLRFEGQPLPSLRALGDGDPLIFSVRTFSKILAPGLRVGWVDADPRIVEKMIAAKQAMDTCTNLPGQLVVADFLTGGHLPAHLDRLRDLYRTRKRAMQDQLIRHLSDKATWTDPAGGFFLWLTVPGIDTSTLFETGLAGGVAFIPGRALSASGNFGDALRLCFASTAPERTAVGIQRLATSIEALSAT